MARPAFQNSGYFPKIPTISFNFGVVSVSVQQVINPNEIRSVFIKIAEPMQILALPNQPVGATWVIAVLSELWGGGGMFCFGFLFLLSPCCNPVAYDWGGNFTPLLLGFWLENFGDLVERITFASEHQNFVFEQQNPAVSATWVGWWKIFHYFPCHIGLLGWYRYV